jgi:PTH1 family peptidyl-tRNA hydrolase
VAVSVRVIAGLGNPGQRYRDTRHNVGYLVADRLAEILGARALAAPGPELVLQRAVAGDGQVVYLAKPVTFMNCSGVAVQQVVQCLGVAPDRLLVICDCLDLPLGRIRLRQGGSSGGHRGLDSVIRELGSDQFPRLRVGIGRPGSGTGIDHVLASWAAAELPVIGQSVSAAAEAACLLLRAGLPAAMNRFNGWTAAADDAAMAQGEPGIENVRGGVHPRSEEG